jgi:hypothetical protein
MRVLGALRFGGDDTKLKCSGTVETSSMNVGAAQLERCVKSQEVRISRVNVIFKSHKGGPTKPVILKMQKTREQETE